MSRLLPVRACPPRVCTAAAGVVFCALALFANDAAATPTLAILPAAGDTPRDQRTKLDAALRKAVLADGSYTVQSAKDTQEQIAFMAEQGTICVASDIACLQRLGILCDVQYLLIPETTGSREMNVTLTLLNAEDALVVRTVDGVINLATNSAPKLIDTTLHGGDEPPPPPPPKEDPLTSNSGSNSGSNSASNSNPAQPVDETQLNDMQFAGAATAGVAGGLGVLGALGALGGEAVFWSGGGAFDVKTRLQVAQITQVVWVATAVAAVTAGVGVGVYFAGAPDEQKSIDTP